MASGMGKTAGLGNDKHKKKWRRCRWGIFDSEMEEMLEAYTAETKQTGPEQLSAVLLGRQKK